MKKDFQNFLETLQESIVTWGYFCDFEKAHNNSFKISIQLHILDALLGKENLKESLFQIVEKYPETRSVLPILIATRKSKISELPIIDPITLSMENKSYLFDEKIKLTDEIKKELWSFIEESGLIDIFRNKKINNLEDYVFGVEIGLDSNARKNRTGKLMENTVELFISNFCKKNGLEFITQATKTKIFEKFGVNIKMDISKRKSGERKFDFAIFNKKNNRLVIIETNYYSSTGSKPSSIAREYIDLHNILKKENITFMWITDGVGWRKMKNPLEKTINEIDYVVNLKILKNGVLKEIFE